MTAFPALVIDDGRIRRLDDVGDALDIIQVESPTGTLILVANDVYAATPNSTSNIHADAGFIPVLVTSGITSTTSTINASKDWNFTGNIVTTGNITANVGTFNTVNSADSKYAFYNGTFRETFDALVTSNGTAITLSLEPPGGGPLLTMQFSDGETVLPTSPAVTLNIAPGTDTSPVSAYVYIPQDTKVLTVNYTSWPQFTEHIKVAYLLVPSATFVQDHGGTYVNQNWNDHLSSDSPDAQGHLAHMCVKLRQQGADWYSGVSPAGATVSYFTISANTVTWQSTEGLISQLHPQTFDSINSASGNAHDHVIVKNDSAAPYKHITNLHDITDDSTGASIPNNRYFNLVFWGVVNKGGEFAGIVCNLPAGNYTLQSDALIDTDALSDYSFPREYDIESGVAFLVARTTFKMGATWTHVVTEDLRGKNPNNSAGGGGTNDHGSLGGLGDDDHTQYALVDGTRAFTGNVTAPAYICGGGFTSNTGTVNFNDDHIVTTGNVTANTLVLPGGASITSTAGTIDFGSDHTITTGNTTANTYSATNYIRSDTLRSYSGTISLPSGGNISAAGYIQAGTNLIANSTAYADDIRSNTGTVISLGAHELTTTGCLTANTVTATVVLELPTYNDSTRPTASTLAAGSAIFNTDDAAPNYSDGTAWRDAVGVAT